MTIWMLRKYETIKKANIERGHKGLGLFDDDFVGPVSDALLVGYLSADSMVAR